MDIMLLIAIAATIGFGAYIQKKSKPGSGSSVWSLPVAIFIAIIGVGIGGIVRENEIVVDTKANRLALGKVAEDVSDFKKEVSDFKTKTAKGIAAIDETSAGLMTLKSNVGPRLSNIDIAIDEMKEQVKTNTAVVAASTESVNNVKLGLASLEREMRSSITNLEAKLQGEIVMASAKSSATAIGESARAREEFETRFHTELQKALSWNSNNTVAITVIGQDLANVNSRLAKIADTPVAIRTANPKGATTNAPAATGRASAKIKPKNTNQPPTSTISSRSGSGAAGTVKVVRGAQRNMLSKGDEITFTSQPQTIVYKSGFLGFGRAYALLGYAITLRANAEIAEDDAKELCQAILLDFGSRHLDRYIGEEKTDGAVLAFQRDMQDSTRKVIRERKLEGPPVSLVNAELKQEPAPHP